jgi:hypothetical protein
MVESQNSFYRLKITSVFLALNAASLGIILTIGPPTVERGSAVIVAAQALKGGATLPEIQAVGDEGELPISSEISSENGICGWVTGRDTPGGVKLLYTIALASKLIYGESKIYPNPSGKGLLGSWLSFVGISPADNVYQNIVRGT